MIYIYFDYKAQQSQNDNDIARSLLKQLLSLSNLSSELERLYDDCMLGSFTPDTATLIRHLKAFSQIGPVYAIFDGMDECREDNLEEMFSLFTNLQESGYKLLFSTRPHLLQYFRERLRDLQISNILADNSDLRSYILFRLRKARNNNRELEAKCLDIIKDVQGV